MLVHRVDHTSYVVSCSHRYAVRVLESSHVMLISFMFSWSSWLFYNVLLVSTLPLSCMLIMLTYVGHHRWGVAHLPGSFGYTSALFDTHRRLISSFNWERIVDSQCSGLLFYPPFSSQRWLSSSDDELVVHHQLLCCICGAPISCLWLLCATYVATYCMSLVLNVCFKCHVWQ